MNLMPQRTPDAQEQEVARFRALYKARFGVDSKPEYDDYVARHALTGEQGVQLMEDMDTLLHHVFDAMLA